jgi:hypothetical protein
VSTAAGGQGPPTCSKVDAKCLDNQDEVAKRRVEAALNEGLMDEAAEGRNFRTYLVVQP